MSKRKNRSSAPNLPESTLERARRQAAGEPVDEVKPESAAPTPQPAAVRPKPAVTRREEPESKRARRREVGPVQYTARKKETLDQDDIARLLSNPTITVTEDELKQQYSYVLADLRSMGTLAVILVVALVILAQVL